MPRIEQQYLISSQVTTPQTDILVQNFYSTFDNRSGANRHIANVDLLHYSGLIAGSEFLAYAATKMYLCLNVVVSSNLDELLNRPVAIFYDSANAASITISNTDSHFDTIFFGGQHHYAPNPIELNNFYFSRLAVIDYVSIIFTGWRMTLD